MARNQYQEVRSPQLFHRSLWERSGHWEHFSQNIYSAGDEMVLKPMNCPAHIEIFKAQDPSYRDLPMRIAEFGCCHRNEPSGALHGIMRVRQFVQDDGHIFCAEHDIENEVEAFCHLLKQAYHAFGFDKIEVAISLRPESRAGDDDLWDRAEAMLIAAVERAGLPYSLQPGEGAFYGPKVEFALQDSAGRSWQCGTAQLDFVLPERLGARYMGRDGQHHTPVIIHRAILGSLERFIGILLEHYEGRLPMWLSPVQAVVIAAKPEAQAYADAIAGALEMESRMRIVRGDPAENMRNAIKRFSDGSVPAIIVVGPRDEAEKTAVVRWRNGDQVSVHRSALGSFLINS